MIRPTSPLGALLVLLALLMQLAAGALMPRAGAMPASGPGAGLGSLCHADNGPTPAAPPRHVPDCALCPLCATLVAPVPLLGGAPLLGLPGGATVAAATARPPMVVPPGPTPGAAQPRGPPPRA